MNISTIKNSWLFIVFFTLVSDAVSSSNNTNDQGAIRTEVFAYLPDVTMGRLSPDGVHFASLVRVDTPDFQGSAIHVLNVDSKQSKLHAATDNTENTIASLIWVNNETLIIQVRFSRYRYETDSTESRYMTLNALSGKTAPLVGSDFFRTRSYMPQSQGYILSTLPKDPEHILLGIGRKPNKGEEVFRVNVNNQNTQLVQESYQKYYNWKADQQRNVRLAEKSRKGKTLIQLKTSDKNTYRTLWEYEHYSSDGFYVRGFDKNPNILFYLAYHEGFLALFKADVTNDPLQHELVHSLKGEDLEGSLVFRSRVNPEVVGFYQSNNGSYFYWGQDQKSQQAALDRVFPDTTNEFYDQSDNEKRAIVYRESSKDPGAYYLWDREHNTMDLLAQKSAELSPEKMSRSTPVSFTSKDGTMLNALLTLPNETKQVRPTIIIPAPKYLSSHSNNFNNLVQLFANRGFNVIRVDDRGAYGSGIENRTASFGNWPEIAQSDVEDATRWGIKQGIASKGNICIVGFGYGGYLALMEAVKNSDSYACAASISGVSDLPDMFKHSKLFTNHNYVKKVLGSDLKKLRKLSPVSLSDSIEVPVMLVHAIDDVVIPVQQSRAMHRALTKNNKLVEYKELKEAGHYFKNQDQRIILYSSIEQFLNDNLMTE